MVIYYKDYIKKLEEIVEKREVSQEKQSRAIEQLVHLKLWTLTDKNNKK